MCASPLLLTNISDNDIMKADISDDDIEEGKMSQNIVLTESTYYILLALYKPQHGYGIMQQVEDLSGGRVRLAAGTLYGALNVLCEKEWIIPLPFDKDSRKKEYKLTEKGLQILKNELERLRQLVKNGEEILKGER